MEPHCFDRVRPDGTIIEIHGWPLADGGGFVTTYTDVTEQRRANQALEESRRRADELNDQLLDAIEAMPASFVFHDRDGKLVMCNRKTIEYFPELSHLFKPGTQWEDLVRYAFDNELWRVDSQELVRLRDERIALRKRGEPQASEQQWHDGRWFEVFESRTRSGGWVGIRVDVTARKLAEEKLVAANQEAELASRAKSEFLANMSHELRTPLNAIIGFTEVLLNEPYGPLGSERYKEYLGDIHQSGTHLAEILGDILDLSRIEAGKAELSESTIELASEVEACLRIVDQRAAEKRVALNCELESAPRTLVVDARMFRQILINLLSNAVKFTPEGGSATVFARIAEDGSCEVGVRDTGIGMTPEDVAKAMEVFGQVESTLSRRYEGTGLGLPLTASLVELHGGTFRLDSAPGRGTTALCHLPAARVAASRAIGTA
jgi:signal transduction histidine kinase